MTRTIRETDNFALFEGEGMGKGCFAVLRDSDKQTTLFNTGTEGSEWADSLKILSDRDFDDECIKLDFS